MDALLPTTGGYRRHLSRFFFRLLILGLGWFGISSLNAAGTLVVLHSYHSGYWWTDDQADGIRLVIDQVAPSTEPRREFLDLLRHDSPEHRVHLLNLLRVKYAHESVAVVLTTDEPALRFAVEYRNELFPEAAIVFSGLHGELPAFLEGQRKVTGVVETRDPTAALKVIRHFHPRFRRALVIYDSLAPPDEARFRPDLFGPASQTGGVVFTLMAYPEFEAALGNPAFKPNPEVIFLINSLRNTPVEKSEIDRQVQLIRRYADVPIYHICSPTLGEGSVGGDLYSGRQQGMAAAALALRILNGEDPESLPVQHSHFARFVVDYPEFQRWGLNPQLLTRDLVVINRPFSFYATYHVLVWAVTGVIAILTILVAILGWTIVWNKRVERSLKESEKRFEFILGVTHTGLDIIDTNFTVQYVDPAWQKIYGDYHGRKCYEYFMGRSEACRVCGVVRALETRQPSVTEEMLPRENNRRVEVHTIPFQTAQGEWLVAEFNIDITERKATEETLRFTQFAVDHSAMGVIWMDAQGRVTYANAAACHALEYTAEDLSKKTVFDFDLKVTPESLKDLWGKLRRKTAVSLESEHRSRTGRVYPVEVTSSYLEYNGREFLCAFLRDISDRKSTEGRLRDERNLLRTLIDNLPDLIYIKDPGGRFLAGNQALAQLLGVEHHAYLIGRSDTDFLPRELAERNARDDREVVRTGRPLMNREELVRSASGEDLWFMTSKLPLRGQDGQIIGLVGIGRNTTERKQALDALQASEERLRRVVAGAPIILFAIDSDGICTLSDGKGLSLLNLKADELVGRNLFDYFRDAPQFLGDIHRALEGAAFAGTHEIRDRTFETFFTPIQTADGQVMGTTGISTDITDRQKAEQQLLRSQKMEAIGKLAGGVAHDFNNILTGILGYAHLVIRKTEPGSPVRLAGETIEKAAERAAELTKQLLGFARQGKLQNVPVDFHAVIHEVIALLARTFDLNIRIIQRLQTPNSTILGDPSQLQQVVLNLTVNARDAMPHGGELTFSTEEKQLDEAFVRLQPGIQPGRYLLFALTDTGQGIPWGIQQRIFEPFFTTKEAGKGTGMGLAMVYSIVKNHGGFIQLESAEGKGTTFRIYLPLQTNPVATEPAAGQEMAVPRGQGRVLVIDDDEMIRALSSRLLQELGYTAITASSAVEGLNVYRAAQGGINLALVDMSMPDIDGQACFRALRAYDPRACVVLFSGMRLDAQIQGLLDEGLAGYIQKPYKLADLAQVLQQALAGRSVPP
jgi:PAS domain S-box-containing protein